MNFDPYGTCFCGSGKKLKWCCLEYAPAVSKVAGLLQNSQYESALRYLEQANPKAISPELADSLKTGCLSRLGRIEEAIQTIETVIERHPTFALARETRAEALLIARDYAEALDGFRDALAHYSPEATMYRVQAMHKIGLCEHQLGRPIAAWAAWSVALRVDPEHHLSLDAISQLLAENSLVARVLKAGIPLKSPQTDQSRELWDKMKSLRDFNHLDDLAMLYEDVLTAQPEDAEAQYNLGVVAAWMGDNSKAIEAFGNYLPHETDFAETSRIWEMVEILRMGAGAEDECDHLEYIADYDITQQQVLLDLLGKSDRTVLLRNPDRSLLMVWADRPVSKEAAERVGDRAGWPLGRLNFNNQLLELVATVESKRDELAQEVEAAFGEAIKPIGRFQRPATLHSLDLEPVLAANLNSAGAFQDRLNHAAAHYFEELWIHRPLRALDGLSPVDAAQSPKYRAKLEGVVRFRENNFIRFESQYSFATLRNKLGLEELPAAATTLPIHSLSPKQLAELDPAALSDQQLRDALRIAKELDLEGSIKIFTDEMKSRPPLAEAMHS